MLCSPQPTGDEFKLFDYEVRCVAARVQAVPAGCTTASACNQLLPELLQSALWKGMEKSFDDFEAYMKAAKASKPKTAPAPAAKKQRQKQLHQREVGGKREVRVGSVLCSAGCPPCLPVLPSCSPPPDQARCTALSTDPCASPLLAPSQDEYYSDTPGLRSDTSASEGEEEERPRHPKVRSLGVAGWLYCCALGAGC